MHKTIEIEGKSVDVVVTDQAVAALKQRMQPVLAELELYFSCLIRKQVRFRELTEEDVAHPVAHNLSVSFRPVMTEHCSKEYSGEEPPLTRFPIKKVKPFVPTWVRIDFAFGQWQGEFGYSDEQAA